MKDYIADDREFELINLIKSMDEDKFEKFLSLLENLEQRNDQRLSYDVIKKLMGRDSLGEG